MIDRKAKAVQHIKWANEQAENEGDLGTSVRDDALIAQVHATLYLAEQQRVANLIALDQERVMRDGIGRIRRHIWQDNGLLDPEIAAVLGLEPSDG